VQVLRLKRWKLWTPDQISPLAWYDAKDGTYITESGGLVDQWDDKSGNTRHISQVSDPAKPTYAADTVSFDGLAQYLFNTSPFMYANGNLSVSFVGAVNPTQLDRRMITECSTLSNTPFYSIAQGGNSDASKMDAFIRNDVNSLVLNHPGISDSGAFNNTQRLYVCGDTGSRVMGNFNGGALTQVSYTRSDTLTPNRVAMGAVVRAAVSLWLECRLNEIIITNFMDLQARYAMEGYLAWRWGLQGLLPADHRFKSDPPRVPLVV
jgi:hypothetical protein